MRKISTEYRIIFRHIVSPAHIKGAFWAAVISRFKTNILEFLQSMQKHVHTETEREHLGVWMLFGCCCCCCCCCLKRECRSLYLLQPSACSSLNVIRRCSGMLVVQVAVSSMSHYEPLVSTNKGGDLVVGKSHR